MGFACGRVSPVRVMGYSGLMVYGIQIPGSAMGYKVMRYGLRGSRLYIE